MSVIPALKQLRQEDCYEFKASRGYIVSTRPAKTVKQDSISQKQNKWIKSFYGFLPFVCGTELLTQSLVHSEL